MFFGTLLAWKDSHGMGEMRSPFLCALHSCDYLSPGRTKFCHHSVSHCASSSTATLKVRSGFCIILENVLMPGNIQLSYFILGSGSARYGIYE